MTALSLDAAALCAAIDAGDDTALAPLADALEEAGDGRAAGLRRLDDPSILLDNGAARPTSSASGWSWWLRVTQMDVPQYRREIGWSIAIVLGRHSLPPAVFDRLIGGELTVWDDVYGATHKSRTYLRRSAAYLALAEALTETE